MYPSVLILLTLLLMVFLVTYVVPNFAALYTSMQAQLPKVTVILIAIGTTARTYILLVFAAIVVLSSSTASGQEGFRPHQNRHRQDESPAPRDIWLKYQVAQFSRVLSTLLTGGIPLVQGLETASDSLGTPLLRRSLDKAGQNGARRPSLSASLKTTGIFPPLSIDMIEVESPQGRCRPC